MPYPCSYWAVRTFGKDDPSRTKFETIAEITDALRTELNAEEEKLGRPALPKLVYELPETDEKKKQKKLKSTAAAEAAPAFSASALDGAATVSDADWVKAKFVVGGAVAPLKKDKTTTTLTITNVEGQVVTLKGDGDKTTTMTKTALMEAWAPAVKAATQATRWVPTRVPHTRRRRRRRRRGGDVYAVT